MSSESENRYLEAKEALKSSISTAANVTPCVMISEQNWSAMVRAVRSIEILLRHVVTNLQMAEYVRQLGEIFDSEVNWLEEKENSMAMTMEKRSQEISKDLESQAGKLNEQYASALERTRKELQEDFRIYTEKMYHRFLLPCLFLILLVSVLILLQMLQR